MAPRQGVFATSSRRSEGVCASCGQWCRRLWTSAADGQPYCDACWRSYSEGREHLVAASIARDNQLADSLTRDNTVAASSTPAPWPMPGPAAPVSPPRKARGRACAKASPVGFSRGDGGGKRGRSSTT